MKKHAPTIWISCGVVWAIISLQPIHPTQATQALLVALACTFTGLAWPRK